MLKHLTAAAARDIAAKAGDRRAALRAHERARRASGRITASGSAPPPSLDNPSASDALPDVRAAAGAVGALSLEELRELAALIWLGRGDHESWEEALDHARQVVGESTAGYLLAKNKLAHWLRAGLDKIGL